MKPVSVIIPTYGDRSIWGPLADRAATSVATQRVQASEIIQVHGSSLAEARNEGAERATSEWLIFLDADDELDPGYVEAMFQAEGDLRRPNTIGIYPDGSEDDAPCMIPRSDLANRNYIVIGSMHRREQFLRVGGFDPSLPMSEDWDLWCRIALDGAVITDVPDAVYRVHVLPNSRNSDGKIGGKVYGIIKGRYRNAFNCLYGRQG